MMPALRQPFALLTAALVLTCAGCQSTADIPEKDLHIVDLSALQVRGSAQTTVAGGNVIVTGTGSQWEYLAVIPLQGEVLRAARPVLTADVEVAQGNVSLGVISGASTFIAENTLVQGRATTALDPQRHLVGNESLVLRASASGPYRVILKGVTWRDSDPQAIARSKEMANYLYREQLAMVVQGAATDYDRVRLIRRWVHKRLCTVAANDLGTFIPQAHNLVDMPELYYLSASGRLPLYCGGYATVYAESLARMGFVTYLLNFGTTTASHVLVLVEVRDHGVAKLLVEDPFLDRYLADADGEPLDLHVAARLLSEGKGHSVEFKSDGDGHIRYAHLPEGVRIQDITSASSLPAGTKVETVEWTAASLEGFCETGGYNAYTRKITGGRSDNMAYLLLNPIGDVVPTLSLLSDEIIVARAASLTKELHDARAVLDLKYGSNR